MKKDDCIFCKLANGIIPTNSIYEDEDFNVILDMAPAAKGHALILPKEHADNLYELPEETAAKVLELTDRIVKENQLTTLMITHNMKDAIAHGNRLIMMHEGRVILDIAGEDKKKLTVDDLLAKFSVASGSEFANDRAMLS